MISVSSVVKCFFASAEKASHTLNINPRNSAHVDSLPNIDTARQELLAELARVQPGARLLPLYWLRRIIRRHKGMPASAGPAPHEHGYSISRDELKAVVDPAEVGLSEPLPDHLLLMPELNREEIRDQPTTWHHRFEEALFHDRLDSRFDEVFSTFVSTRILWTTIGKSQQEEIRRVLTEQYRLFPDDDNRTIVRETVGLFLELWHFDPLRLDDFFPGLTQEMLLEELIESKLQSRQIAADCRLKLNSAAPIAPSKPAAAMADADPLKRSQLRTKATQSSAKGNDVRALLIEEKLGDTAAADETLKQFIVRVQSAIGHETTQDWKSALTVIRQRAIAPDLPREARLLFDLQKICIDSERPIYAVEVMEAVITLGRKPIKRELSRAREVRILRHLRSAAQHAFVLADADTTLVPLATYLKEAEHATEHKLRDRLRPILLDSLKEVGLEPVNLPEQVARDNMVEEMLDAIVVRGFLRMSDARDAIARNRLKLNDLSGIGEFWKGDALLRLNKLLPYKLDGIYQRGEIYLRAFQRGSSVFFGTDAGRLFTKFVALPFGGAFLFLEGAHHFYEAIGGFARYLFNNPRPEHLVDNALKSVTQLLPLRRTIGRIGRYVPEEATWATPSAVILLGLFLLAMFQVRSFRQAVFTGVRKVLWDWPQAVFESQTVQLILHNSVTKWMRRYMLVPALFGGAATVLLRLLGDDFLSAAGFGMTIGFLSGVFFRTRTGREIEERVDEIFEFVWRRISLRLIVGSFEAIFFFFRNVMEYIERGIYLVDEWLRFREGENRLVYYFKLTAGIVWFFLTYAFRFGWNLLIEPQINPIKHFPVVTVSHKLLLPLIPSLTETFSTSIATMTTIVGGIPGIFGFLAWELKENWKLYRRNASPTLDPVPLGSHGERMKGLLRPGFHSGTIPKAFARLRNSQTPARIRTQHEQIHHIEEALKNFMERLVLPYLVASPRWTGHPLPEPLVWIATNRIGFSLYLPEVSQDASLDLMIEDRDAILVASILNPGWLRKVTSEAQSAFLDVLSATLKYAGVRAFKPHTAWVIGGRADQIEIGEGGLILHRDDGQETPISRPEALIENREISWNDWVNHWQKDQRGDSTLEAVLLKREMV